MQPGVNGNSVLDGKWITANPMAISRPIQSIGPLAHVFKELNGYAEKSATNYMALNKYLEDDVIRKLDRLGDSVSGKAKVRHDYDGALKWEVRNLH